MIEFILRTMTADDKSYVARSYLKSLKELKPWLYAPNDLYFKGEQEDLEFLFDTAHTTVAVYPEEPDQIVGFAIHEPMPSAMVLHYIYARYAARGIRRQILQGILGGHRLVIASHPVDRFTQFQRKVEQEHEGVRVAFDPYILRRLREMRGRPSNVVPFPVPTGMLRAA